MFCEICDKPIYGHVCDDCRRIVKNVKELKSKTEEIFQNNFDCYSQTVKLDFSFIAMSFEKFKEIVDNL